MKKTILFSIFSLITLHVYSQEDLFGKKKDNEGGDKNPAHHGWLIGVNGDLDFPAADMAKRFGVSYRIGPSVLYKTQKNWLFGVKADFISGNQMKDDSLMYNIKDHTGNMLDQDGSRLSPNLYERGYIVGIQGGKIFNTNKNNKDDGIMLLGTLGFIQHKIKIMVNNNSVPEVRSAYTKGYDRLTNGLLLEGYAGYTHFGKDGLLNYNVGIDIAAGFTQGRRDYQFDLMRPDNQSRLDLLIGIRATWYIPIFKRKSEEYVF